MCIPHARAHVCNKRVLQDVYTVNIDFFYMKMRNKEYYNRELLHISLYLYKLIEQHL